jgi:hypothetical protein
MQIEFALTHYQNSEMEKQRVSDIENFKIVQPEVALVTLLLERFMCTYPLEEIFQYPAILK